jgi:GMP synthase (glutamine-hydrolysing)
VSPSVQGPALASVPVSEGSRFLLLQARPERDAREREAVSMAAATGLGDRLDVLSVDVDPLPADLFDRYAGVITGGSPYSVSDAGEHKSPGQRLAEAQLTRVAEQALERDAPAFFTCFGIGLVTLALGGAVDRTHPEPVSAAAERLTEAGRADPIAGALPDRFFALTGHKESAPEVPPGATLLATNDVSPVQLYRVGNVLASQFHPEPTTQDFVDRATTYSRYGYFDERELPTLAEAILRAEITEPRKLLQGFVALASAV